MLKKIEINPKIITKVKYFEDSVVVYSKEEFWVCKPTQKIDKNQPGLIVLELKDKCEVK